MNIPDLSFRFALLETRLCEMGFSSKKVKPISADIIGRISELTETLSSPPSLSSRIVEQLPSWCDDCDTLLRQMVGSSEYSSNREIETLNHSIDELRKRCLNHKESHGLPQQRVSLPEAQPISQPKKGFFSWAISGITHAMRRTGSLVTRCFHTVASAGGNLRRRAVAVALPAISWWYGAFTNQDERIQKKQEQLDLFVGETHGKKPSTLATTLSQYIFSYFEEHVMHIQEREPALRPPFLSVFFHDLYSADPKPTTVGIGFQNLLSTKKEEFRKCIEDNLLFFLNNVSHHVREGSFINEPYAVVKMFHETLNEVVKNVESDSSLSGEMEKDDLVVAERNKLLTGDITRNLVHFILSVGFPRGALDVQIGPVEEPPSSDNAPIVFPGRSGEIVGPLEPEANTVQKKIYSAINDALFEELQDRLISLTKNNDLQDEFLLQIYRQINSFLNPSSEQQQNGGPISALFPDFEGQKIASEPVAYEYESDLVESLQKGATLLLQGTGLEKWIGRINFSKMARELSSRFRSFDTQKMLQLIFPQLETMLTPSQVFPSQERTSESKLFPRTQQEIQAREAERDARRKQRAEELLQEMTQLQKNVPHMAKMFARWKGFNDIPSLNEQSGLSTRIERVCKKIVNAVLTKFIQAFFKIIAMKSKIRTLNQQIAQQTQKIPQDTYILFLCDWLGRPSHTAA